MYGIRVHEAVLDAGEKETGISIHLVDQGYYWAGYRPDACSSDGPGYVGNAGRARPAKGARASPGGAAENREGRNGYSRLQE
jgi:hypothetical protein